MKRASWLCSALLFAGAANAGDDGTVILARAMARLHAFVNDFDNPRDARRDAWRLRGMLNVSRSVPRRIPELAASMPALAEKITRQVSGDLNTEDRWRPACYEVEKFVRLAGEKTSPGMCPSELR